MRNIKKFTSIEDLGESGLNLAPQEYTLYISKDGQGHYSSPEFYYYLKDAQDANFTGTTQGIFADVTPGVAYLNTQENKSVLYNPKFEPIEVSGSDQNWTWEEWGMTMDLYNKYLASAKAYAHPSAFNILINGNVPRRVEYANHDVFTDPITHVEELRFMKNCWALAFDPINEIVRVFNNCG